jgi:hypothetical protein
MPAGSRFPYWTQEVARDTQERHRYHRRSNLACGLPGFEVRRTDQAVVDDPASRLVLSGRLEMRIMVVDRISGIECEFSGLLNPEKSNLATTQEKRQISHPH